MKGAHLLEVPGPLLQLAKLGAKVCLCTKRTSCVRILLMPKFVPATTHQWAILLSSPSAGVAVTSGATADDVTGAAGVVGAFGAVGG